MQNRGGTPDLHHTVSGVVRSVTPSAANSYVVTIDICSGDACAAESVVFDILSTTPLVLPVGAFVEADYWIRESFACSYFLRLTNLPTFNGQANPISDKTKTHFLASDGFFNANPQLSPLGVTVTPIPLGCAPDASTHFPTPVDTYVFKFSLNGDERSFPWASRCLGPSTVKTSSSEITVLTKSKPAIRIGIGSSRSRIAESPMISARAHVWRLLSRSSR